jgi:hypothetical protein
MNKKYLEGGLKMIDIDKYIEAIQIKWIKKLTSKNFANWKVIPFYYFNKYQRRTNNTMAKRNSAKGQTTIYKTCTSN